MDIDPTYLLLALMFSVVGLALFVYGKKAQRTPHLMAGLALMTFPYFITNAMAMASIGIVLAIVPFVVPQV